jgi:predicted ATPase
VAADLRDAFADGVWLIALASLRDPGLVLTVIAQTLGVAERAGVPLLDSLTAYLGERETLLVLDNFEHVLPAGCGATAPAAGHQPGGATPSRRAALCRTRAGASAGD